MEKMRICARIKAGGAAMKSSKHLKVLFFLTVITLFLPWFTYNAKVMGYCYGYSFWKWFLLPVVIIGIFLIYPKRAAALTLLAQISQLSCFFILVYAFGFWQEVNNIRAGAQWLDGFHTVQPGFWVSVGFFVLFFVSFQIDQVKGDSRASA